MNFYLLKKPHQIVGETSKKNLILNMTRTKSRRHIHSRASIQSYLEINNFLHDKLCRLEYSFLVSSSILLCTPWYRNLVMVSFSLNKTYCSILWIMILLEFVENNKPVHCYFKWYFYHQIIILDDIFLPRMLLFSAECN